VPVKAWFTYFRFYGPLKTYFDKTWPLPDVKNVKRTVRNETMKTLVQAEPKPDRGGTQRSARSRFWRRASVHKEQRRKAVSARGQGKLCIDVLNLLV
jgi:hypothetical protein